MSGSGRGRTHLEDVGNMMWRDRSEYIHDGFRCITRECRRQQGFANGDGNVNEGVYSRVGKEMIKDDEGCIQREYIHIQRQKPGGSEEAHIHPHFFHVLHKCWQFFGQQGFEKLERVRKSEEVRQTR